MPEMQRSKTVFKLSDYFELDLTVGSLTQATIVLSNDSVRFNTGKNNCSAERDQLLCIQASRLSRQGHA